MNIPCLSGYADCPCIDLPGGNYSSEQPDRQVWFGWYFGSNLFRPRLGSNWRRSHCLGICTSDISQAEADLCAVLAGLHCLDDWGVPPITPPSVIISGPPLIPGTPTGGPDIFFSSSVAFQRNCPDGTPFFYSVGPGVFWADSQDLADRMALSYAERLASTTILCFGTLRQCGCVGQNYTDTLIVTTDRQVTFEIVGGALPPGLNLSQFAPNRTTIGGTIEAAGNYTFTVRASIQPGVYIEKTFTIYCMGISPSPTLPNGYYETNYTQLLTVSGGTPPYSYAFGGFPCDILPTSFAITDYGLLYGDPDTVRTYNFCVVVRDALGCECSFPLELEIKGICNSDISETSVCPCDVTRITTQTVAADTFCGPVGTNPYIVDGQARAQLTNQIATALRAQGCDCVWTANYSAGTVTNLGLCTIQFLVRNYPSLGILAPGPSAFNLGPGATSNFVVDYWNATGNWLNGFYAVIPFATVAAPPGCVPPGVMQIFEWHGP